MNDSAAVAGQASGNPAPPRPQRPREMQDALNHYLYHPLAWQLARQLAKTPLTPNMVSVIGAFFVIGAAAAYAQPGWPFTAMLGMALHMGWHVVDGADGDLARITGRASPIGEMVDGLCDYSSHIVLYLVLGLLLHTAIGTGAAVAWMLAAGVSHIIQSNHVEVQRRSYQWGVYGTPWIRMSHGSSDAATRKSVFGALVSAYLAVAGKMTPHARRIDALVEAAKDDPQVLARIRAVVRAEAPPLLRICKILGPNPRAVVLGIAMIAGGSATQAVDGTMGPLWYFIYQSVVLNLVLVWSLVAHNAAARRMADELEAELG